MKKNIYIVIVLIIAALLTGCSSVSGKETMGTETEVSNRSYTTEYLNSIMDDINEYLNAHQGSDDELYLVIQSAGVYEDCVKVFLDKVTDDIIKQFKEKVSDSDAIIFEVGERYHFLNISTNTPRWVSNFCFIHNRRMILRLPRTIAPMGYLIGSV